MLNALNFISAAAGADAAKTMQHKYCMLSPQEYSFAV